MAVVGIDLGTTNSSVAVFKDGWTTVIQDENGSRLLPSVVTFTEKEILVGPRATSYAHKYPKDTIYDAKRFIGQKYHDKNIQNDIASSQYEIVNKDGFPHVNVTYKNEKLILSIEEVSAYVLKQLKRITENHLNGSVNEAVITVPAHFDDARRNATKRAAKIAGFDIIHIINEPTAAAIASQYGSTKTHRRKILVYDFGGGTFDVSIISIIEKHFNVLATSGDCYLGGKDLDMILMSHVKRAVEDDGGRSITDRKTLNRLRNICEEAKKYLSLSLEYYIDLPGVIDDYKITREDFERLNEDLFQRTVIVVDNCLTASKLTVDDIDEVILVGGSSRVQRVRDILRTKFPKSTIDTSFNPDEAIACGAAIYGAKLNGDKVELVIKDVLSVSLGVECRCDIMHHTIKRNTSLPCSASVTYSTAHHFQTELPISVYQGESLIASRNKFLGKFTISDIRKERRGVVQILTTFNVDEEGILKVTASEVGAANNSRELIVSISDEIVLMSETTDEEELRHIEFSIKKLRLLEYCDDLKVDYKESLAARPDISGKIEEACEKCESLKADGITIVEDLMSELELLVENIES